MNTRLKKIKYVLPLSVYTLLKDIYFYFYFLKDYRLFTKHADTRFELRWGNRKPILDEKTTTTGFDRHYIYHPAWAARIVFEIKPQVHTDISSILYFSTMLSAFIPVDFYDYRPAKVELSNLHPQHADLTKLPFADNSIGSLSCMHTIEHVGLGRYGDPINPKGDLEAMKELIRVVAKGGSLLFVTPIGGKAMIAFNAHRVYTYAMIREYFKELELKEFSLIQAEGERGIIKDASEEQANAESYGCGCFWFIKK